MKIFYLALLLLLTSCAPKVSEINFETLDVENILKNIKDEKNEVNTLQGIARVKAKDNFDSISIKQVTLLETPYKFRLEALAAFGQSIAVILSDGEEVVFRTRGEEVVFEDVKKFNLTYFYPGIPQEIKSGEIIELLLGRVPFGMWENDYDVSFEGGENLLRVEYPNLNGTKTVLQLDPVTQTIKNAEIQLNEEEYVKIEYDDYNDIDNITFPNRISLNYGSNSIKIKYENDLVLNNQIDEGLFLK